MVISSNTPQSRDDSVALSLASKTQDEGICASADVGERRGQVRIRTDVEEQGGGVGETARGREGKKVRGHKASGRERGRGPGDEGERGRECVRVGGSETPSS
eukprot:6198934-Pleurochrysis_carterae.AAC.7